MKVAVFSDIHGNIQALLNVLSDIEDRGFDKLVCLGDLVGYGPRPNMVIEHIRDSQVPTIMGNYDDGVGYERGDCGCAYTAEVDKLNGQASIDWTTSKVTAANKEFLRSLHPRIIKTIEGYRFLFIHGSPRRINEYLYEDRRESSLRRLLEPLDVDVMLCGHTHLPYHRVLDGVHVVNDGSVGKPKDGDPRACYAGFTLYGGVEVEFIRVPYPVEDVAREVVEAGLPEAFAHALLSGGS